MDENQQILYMQIRLIRITSEKVKLTLKQTAQLFKKFDVLKYIRKGFGIFHVEGDEAIYEDVYEYLKLKGANV